MDCAYCNEPINGYFVHYESLRPDDFTIDKSFGSVEKAGGIVKKNGAEYHFCSECFQDGAKRRAAMS